MYNIALNYRVPPGLSWFTGDFIDYNPVLEFGRSEDSLLDIMLNDETIRIVCIL